MAAWAGLRGAVPIVLSTFPMTAGYPAGETIFNVVFFVVLTSVLLQGATVVPLVRWLGLDTGRPAWSSIADVVPLEGAETDVIELQITDELPITGHRLVDVAPDDAGRVISIVRGSRAIIPTGNTRLVKGDRALVAVRHQPGVDPVIDWARNTTPGAAKDRNPRRPERRRSRTRTPPRAALLSPTPPALRDMRRLTAGPGTHPQAIA